MLCQESHNTFDQRDAGSKSRKEEQQIEQHAEECSARHLIKYLCQRDKCKSAALADLTLAQGRKNCGDDDKAGEESNHCIHRADQHSILGNILRLREI